MLVKKTCLFILALTFPCDIAKADDWRQFRGPGSNGVIQDIKIPEVWGVDSNIRWKVGVPGEGWSALRDATMVSPTPMLQPPSPWCSPVSKNSKGVRSESA